MSEEQPPSDNRSSDLTPDASYAFEAPPEDALSMAVAYVDAARASWVLEPTDVELEQPENQQALLSNLEGLLAAQPEGQQLVTHLQRNLDEIRKVSASTERSSAQLAFKAGFRSREFEWHDLSWNEINKVRQQGSTVSEHADEFEDLEDTHLMIAGILEATGALVVRDDLAEGITQDGSRVYKGMLEGRAVYFVESFRLLSGWAGSGTDPAGRWERTFSVHSEEMARLDLTRLSMRDREVLDSIGAQDRTAYLPAGERPRSPRRQDMIDIVHLYDDLAHS